MKIENKIHQIIMTLAGFVMIGICLYTYSTLTTTLDKVYWGALILLNILSTITWTYNVFDLRMDIPHMIYTWKHKGAFLKVEKQLTGKISLRGILHDCDKLFLYLFLDGERVSKIHRKRSKHHTQAKTEKDFIQQVIDWECSWLTKEDKPYNAYETLYKYFPNRIPEILPLLKRFGIDKTRDGNIYV